MCGIAGAVRFDGGACATVARARAMRARLRHRGPDGQGELVDAWVNLQHTRLALLDPARGAQPMTTPNGRYSIVYNGEVYDHLALRRSLDYCFVTSSDAETVLAAFAAWGPACVERLNGMFAFFVWDHVAHRGFAARDRLGVKPLAYQSLGDEFLFASEAQAIAGTAPYRPAVRASAVLEYLVAPYFSGVEAPVFDGIMYLPPGHYLTVDPTGVSLTRYFRYTVGAADAPPACAQSLRAALARAVARASVADAPIGIYLSGGLDSTALAALAPHRPPAFTLAYQDMEAWDCAPSTIVQSNDQPFARLAASELGLELTEVHVPSSALAADLERVARTNDALPAWEQEISQDHLAQMAARTVKAVQVGDAADETHFGYHFLLDAQALAAPRVVLERFGITPIRADVLADPVGTFDAKYRQWMVPTSHHDARVAGMTALIVERWLPRLLHNGDIHAMRWSLEARVPFADTEVLNHAMRVSPAVGLQDGVEKAHLRAALHGTMPDMIRLRRKSALPKPHATSRVYQCEARRLLADVPCMVSDFVDLARVRPLLSASRILLENERAILFRLICMCHFAHHHGIA